MTVRCWYYHPNKTLVSNDIKVEGYILQFYWGRYTCKNKANLEYNPHFVSQGQCQRQPPSHCPKLTLIWTQANTVLAILLTKIWMCNALGLGHVWVVRLDPMCRFLIFTPICKTSKETPVIYELAGTLGIRVDKVTLEDNFIECDIEHCKDTGRLWLEIDIRFAGGRRWSSADVFDVGHGSAWGATCSSQGMMRLYGREN